MLYNDDQSDRDLHLFREEPLFDEEKMFESELPDDLQFLAESLREEAVDLAASYPSDRQDVWLVNLQPAGQVPPERQQVGSTEESAEANSTVANTLEKPAQTQKNFSLRFVSAATAAALVVSASLSFAIFSAGPNENDPSLAARNANHANTPNVVAASSDSPRENSLAAGSPSEKMDRKNTKLSAASSRPALQDALTSGSSPQSSSSQSSLPQNSSSQSSSSLLEAEAAPIISSGFFENLTGAEQEAMLDLMEQDGLGELQLSI